MPKGMGYGGGASKSKAGPVDRKSARKGRAMGKKPKGSDPKGIHPMTGKTGSVKMNRNLKGMDKTMTGKGHNSLAGKYF